MNKSFAVTSLGTLMAVISLSSAQADDERWPRWYVGLTGDFAIMQNQDVSSASTSSLEMDNGFGVGGSIGYLPNTSIPVLNAMRFEAEVEYHQNDVHRANLNGGRQVSGNDANFDTTAYMVNTFYDFPTGTKWSPYIGGGIGFATVHLGTNSNAGNTTSGDNEFAYQAMAGIGYSPDSIPNTQWTLGYRYLATSDPSFNNASTDYSTHNIEVGAKFRF